MTDSERINALKKYLNISVNALARAAGIGSVQTLYDIQNEKHGISKDVAGKISAQYVNISKSWLLTGEGEMLKSSEPSEESDGHVVCEDGNLTPRKKGMIRYWVDVEATGSGVESFDDGITGRYTDMSIPDFRDCTDAINLYGDSMYPTYKSGCVLIIKKWRENFIEYGHIYLIITREGHRMVKYVQPGASDSTITCVSENGGFYPPFEIERNDINGLYIVKGSIEKRSL